MSLFRKLLSLYDNPDQPQASLLSRLEQHGHYKILLTSLHDTGVAEVLNEPGPITLFAPTDDAFARVPRLVELLHDNDRLHAILRHHICIGRFDSTALRGVAKLRPMEGPEIETTHDQAVQDARIVEPDMPAWNGIAHGIDRLLILENHSWLREAGEAVKEDLRVGTLQAAKWIKLSAEKVERALAKNAAQ